MRRETDRRRHDRWIIRSSVGHGTTPIDRGRSEATVSRPIGFSDVDTSERAEELVAYLGKLAERLAGWRLEDYSRLDVKPGAAVLDVGCGAGEVSLELARLVGPDGHVCAVDVSEAMIAAAKTSAKKAGVSIDLRVASAYALPFPDEHFDAVRAERVFQHLDDPARALAEMLRVTRKGGRILVMDADHSQHGISLETDWQCRVYEASRASLLAMIANPRIGTRLRGLFVRAGLADVEQEVKVLEFSLDDYVHAAFLRERLASAVADGKIAADEARQFLAELEAQEGDGAFLANAVGYSVLGVKR
jgi:SAM-dependent methyltransferase